LKSLALPREAHQTNSFNDLGGGLGENRLIEFQDVSETPPKPSGPDNVGKPDLIVDNGNLPPIHVDRAWAAIRHRPGRPWSSSLWFFLPINDELAVPLEGSKARLKSSQHGYRDLGVTTFLKRSSNNVALASDAFLAFDDEAFNLR
jgi:hypothetical protein